jgi:hypothetical protein
MEITGENDNLLRAIYRHVRSIRLNRLTTEQNDLLTAVDADLVGFDSALAE